MDRRGDRLGTRVAIERCMELISILSKATGGKHRPAARIFSAEPTDRPDAGAGTLCAQGGVRVA